ncbi:MAG: hypothetical protein ABEI11_00745 [Haloarculaceae archaeon]
MDPGPAHDGLTADNDRGALLLLSKPQRRRIIQLIAETSDGTTLDRLGRDLEEGPLRTSEGSGGADRRIVELHHVHLPMLREADVIVYDASRGTVRRGREFREVLSLLRAIESHREDTSTEAL